MKESCPYNSPIMPLRTLKDFVIIISVFSSTSCSSLSNILIVYYHIFSLSDS